MSLRDETYEPTAADIAWAISVISLLKDGGIWVFPATGMIFRINHKNKEFELTNVEERDRNEVNARMFRRTQRTFAAIGWSVSIAKAGEEEDTDLPNRLQEPSLPRSRCRNNRVEIAPDGSISYRLCGHRDVDHKLRAEKRDGCMQCNCPMFIEEQRRDD